MHGETLKKKYILKLLIHVENLLFDPTP